MRKPLRRFVVLATLSLIAGCARWRATPRVEPEEAVLVRKREGLTALVAAAAKGPLIPFEKALVIVDQSVVQELLTAAMPFERVIGGRYRVQVTAASVEFDDGFALVRLDGRASVAGTAASAELRVYGDLNVVSLDPASGALRGRIRLIAFEARRVDVLGVGASAERLVEELGREELESFAPLAATLEIPVRFEREVAIPAVETGEVRIAAATLPLGLGVRDVKALRGKLWICVDVDTGPPSPAPAR